jgi:hypothetical protein
MIQRKLSGRSEAKGRNGYYMLGGVDAWGVKRHARAQEAEATVSVDFMSTRPKGSPGARVTLTVEDAREVIAALQEALEEAEDAKQE